MKVSVITPFYNGNAYIHAYEEMMYANERSLRAGDVLEVVIINDSPGVPVQLSGVFATKRNWRVIPNEKNVGIHASRIHGLSEASGDYIVFLDQDDSLAEDALCCMLEIARDQAKSAGQRLCYQVIVANALLEQSDGSWVEWYRTPYHKKQIDRLDTYLKVGTQIMSPGQCMMAKDVIPREWMTRVLTENGADDYYLWLLMLEKGIGFYYLDEPLYLHHRTGENVSGDTRQTDRSTEQFLSYLSEVGFPEKKLRLLARQNHYKQQFRSAGLAGKLGSSLLNPDLCLANSLFKLRTRTGYGFNR
ncbi:MAG: glycosyltransferase family 2 protein [Lachnospiraceae bacterium]|nr:glycosyltransferase family 2 protein [Lachnospiraceae bacterium]